MQTKRWSQNFFQMKYNKTHGHIIFFAYMFPSVSENIQITCSMTIISYNVNIQQSIWCCLTVFACLRWPFHSVSVAEKENIILSTFTYASFNNNNCISMSASLTMNYCPSSIHLTHLTFNPYWKISSLAIGMPSHKMSS